MFLRRGNVFLEMSTRILLIPCHFIADRQWEQGKRQDAMEEHENVLEARKRVFVEEHPDTIMILCWLSPIDNVSRKAL